MRLQDDAVKQGVLFDISEEEPVKKKSKRQASAVVEPKKEVEFAPVVVHGGYEIIGQVRDLHECADTRCQSRQFDIIDDYRGQWRIECMICGTGQQVPAIAGVLPEPVGNDFVFRDGIFEGLSIEDAAKQENGMDYIEWAASSHKRKAVKEACRTWLDSRARRT